MENKSYSVNEFHQAFCRLTGLPKQWSERTIRFACSGYIDPKTKKKYMLPPGWEAFKQGRHWRIQKIVSVKETIQQTAEERLAWLLEVEEKIRKGKTQIPQLPEDVIEKLRHCYQTTIFSKRKHIIQLTFHSNGDIETTLREPIGRLYGTGDIDNIQDLYFFAWLQMIVIQKGAKKIIKEFIPKTKQTFATQAQIDTFNRLCLYCANFKSSENNLYCESKKSSCAKNLSDFCQRLRLQPKHLIFEKIEKTILKNVTPILKTNLVSI